MTTNEQRPADEIQAGDVIAYDRGGALMLVTDPGRSESIRYVGRRVSHHGVTLTVPEGHDGEDYVVGRAMSTMHTPRSKVTVHERRAYSLGDGCPCHHHRKTRGESGPAVFPPVVGEAAPATAAAPVTDAAVSSAQVRRRRVLEVEAPAARRALPAAEPRMVDGARIPYAVASRAVRTMPGWSVKGPAYFGEEAAYLVHTDGRRLKIEEDNRPATQDTHVRVTVKYPDDAPVRIWPVDCPETRFKHDRPAVQLADAIRRKILPTYDAKYPEIKKVTEEHRQAVAAGESTSALIACMMTGGTVTEWNASQVESRPFPGSIEKFTAHVSTGDNMHRAEFRYIDTATLEALTQTYAAMVRAKQERRAAAEREKSPALR